MLACIAGSILIRVGLGLMYLHLIRETDNMASTRSRQLKQCKLKFANCYQLNNGIANVPIFVDKFISRMSLGPISPHLLEHLSGQLMLLSVVSSGVGVCRRIIAGSKFVQILPFYIASMTGLYLFFSISAIVEKEGAKDQSGGLSGKSSIRAHGSDKRRHGDAIWGGQCFQRKKARQRQPERSERRSGQAGL